jgi:hypothetical protein
MKQYRLQLNLFGEGFTLEVFINEEWMIAGTIVQEPNGFQYAPAFAFSLLGARSHSTDSDGEIEDFAARIAGDVAYRFLSNFGKRHTSPPNQDSFFN